MVNPHDRRATVMGGAATGERGVMFVSIIQNLKKNHQKYTINDANIIKYEDY